VLSAANRLGCLAPEVISAALVDNTIEVVPGCNGPLSTFSLTIS
jgi:hypothetical protein